MLPEHGFPTRRYPAEPSYAETPEDDRYLRQFYSTLRGMYAIHVLAGLPRNELLSLSAAGNDAAAVTILLDHLAAHIYGSSIVVAPARWLVAGQRPESPLADKVLNRLTGAATMRSSWQVPAALLDRSEAVSFADLDNETSPADADILIHKGRRVARAVIALAGSATDLPGHRTMVLKLLSLLKQQHAGGKFGVDEFLDAVAETHSGAGSYIQHVMRSASLPGFLASDPIVFRLADDVGGQSRYQILVHVRNDEPAPGVVSMHWSTGYQAEGLRGVLVPGHTSVELGLVAPVPLPQLGLDTYLSLNRQIISLALGTVDTETVTSSKPFSGTRASDWMPPDLGIVVDDLDAGFSVEGPRTGTRRWGSRQKPGEVVVGVPTYLLDGTESGWHRQENTLTVGWGRYRRTLVRIPAGHGDGTASFSAHLPTAGRWRLGYHLPGPRATHGLSYVGDPHDRLGQLLMQVVAGGVRTPVEFDGASAVQGWNDIGVFDLPAGPVSVVVSDATEGDIVIADAVRWQPAEE